MEDSDIIRLNREGEREQAFNMIMCRYSERLYWHIRRMVTYHDDADDCLQNTLIRVWNALETFRGDSGLYTWLYRIATNECITFLKKQQIRNLFTGTEAADNLLSDPYFDGTKAQASLQKAIASLPPKQRAVFNLRYFEEMPYEEISEITGISVGALKASFHHASEKVRKAVKEEIDIQF